MNYNSYLKRHFRNSIVYVFFILSIPKGLIAQTDPAFKPISADIIKLSSKVLDEEWKVYIYVPPKDVYFIFNSQSCSFLVRLLSSGA